MGKKRKFLKPVNMQVHEDDLSMLEILALNEKRKKENSAITPFLSQPARKRSKKKRKSNGVLNGSLTEDASNTGCFRPSKKPKFNDADKNGLNQKKFELKTYQAKLASNFSNELIIVKNISSNGLLNKNGVGAVPYTNGYGNKSFTANGRKRFKFNESCFKADKKSILLQRQSLPIHACRNEIISELTKFETVIVIGETGSGKTTQIPQFIHETHLDKDGTICITQPRRVAAITVAKRVAEEMNSELGDIVGYSVRFEEVTSKRTKVKFVTDGTLLREALSNSLLSKYKWIILDEAHERTINTDILFGIVKAAQKKRKLKGVPLHIIIMSATMDVEHLRSYFNSAAVVFVEGRQHPVEVRSLMRPNSDYILVCLSTLFKIHSIANAGENVLIFLTGQEEIDQAVRLINYTAKDSSLSSYPSIVAVPLYSALPHYKQLNAFSPSLPGQRKVIVSTNIAETSVTIPGIKYVIDSGCIKVKSYNSTSGFDELKVCKISQSSAWQRTGRAGREAPGVCYRAYTDEELGNMNASMVPEILRANLSGVMLKLLAIGIKNVINFDFIDKPKKESLLHAQKDLMGLKAIEVSQNNMTLTDVGKKMAIFPLDPQYAKLLINGPNYSCTEEILSIIAILSSESIFVTPSEKKEEAREKGEKFFALEGDHITLLNIYKGFTESTNKKVWCRKNFLNFRNLTFASDVRRQLLGLCQKHKVPLLSCNQKSEPVLKCLISGLYKNVAEIDFGSKYKVLHSNEIAKIHPSSSMARFRPDYILFTELVKTENTYMRMVSTVKPEWLMEFDANYFRSKHIKKITSTDIQYISY